MNTIYSRFAEALATVQTALEALAAHDCAPLRVEVGERRPRITIEAPTTSRWLRGALKSRITVNGCTRMVMVTSIHGCQIEWQVREVHQRQAVAHG